MMTIKTTNRNADKFNKNIATIASKIFKTHSVFYMHLQVS
ncbi:hypothetical protein JPSP8_21200 [Staphylococcus pseudintermedius]